MTAIIFSGHIRTFKQLYNNNVFKTIFTNADIFIHTYDTIGYWSGVTSVYDKEHISKDYIYNIFDNDDKLKIKDIFIEKENCKIDIINTLSDKMYPRKIYYGRPYNFTSMHMKRLTAIERFFEIKTENYNKVMLLRPDCIIKNTDVEIDDNFYIEGYENYVGQPWLNDVFMIGSVNNFYKLKNIYIESFWKYINEYDGDYDPHSYFRSLMKNYFPNYKFIQCGINSIINTPKGYCNPEY